MLAFRTVTYCTENEETPRRVWQPERPDLCHALPLVENVAPAAFLPPCWPFWARCWPAFFLIDGFLRPLDHHEPFRHGAHTRRAERAADLSAGRDLSRS